MKNWLRHIQNWLENPVSIAPLVTFRVVVGALLAVSTTRFLWLGWVEDHFICPKFQFKYFGFEWVEALSGGWMYCLHFVLLMSSLLVLLGLFYRLAAIVQFLLFTYFELVDLTYYLNHYYFVSLVCLLLTFVPAGRSFSLDVFLKIKSPLNQIPRWAIFIFKFQLAIVYCYAGLWKINSDWLFHALPLKIWLPAHSDLPIIGWLFSYSITAYLFSWIGMIYDCSVVFFLSWKKTRLLAFFTVVVFHLLTGLLFQIGVFPIVMIGATLIFFSENWHLHWQFFIEKIWAKFVGEDANKGNNPNTVWKTRNRLVFPFLAIYFSFQIIFPLRFLAYPGNVFWTEQGYRFSWRVMLMEKAGTATFFIKDKKSGRVGAVVNRDFLNSHQEKQMAMQPDMILQFAHFLKENYEKRGLEVESVTADVRVTLNGLRSKPMFDPTLDLTKIEDSWKPKSWILPY